MELDSKIKSQYDILTCFDTEKAKQLIGQKGYFSDLFSTYEDLTKVPCETLSRVKDADFPFVGDYCCWRFFLPESKLVVPKEKE